jgi:small-conductance mechanosensitive channel
MTVPFLFFLFSATRVPGSLLRMITLQQVLTVIVVIVVALVVLHYATKFIDRVSERNPGSRFVLKWIGQAFRLVVSFVAILVVITTLAPDSDTLLAALGSAAIAIGLGAQKLVQDLVGGMVLMTDRPYQLGDRVRFGESVGEVIHIGLRCTKVRTLDDSVITVPNSDVLSDKVENENYGTPECLVVTHVYLPADTDMKLALKIGREAALCSPFLQPFRPVIAVISDRYSESPYMEMRIKAYVFDHRYVPRMVTDVTRRAKGQLEREGILAKWRSD